MWRESRLRLNCGAFGRELGVFEKRLGVVCCRYAGHGGLGVWVRRNRSAASGTGDTECVGARWAVWGTGVAPGNEDGCEGVLVGVSGANPWVFREEFLLDKVAPGVFCVYEPHQAEETIAYLIVGHKQAVLFDTGMGISDIHRVTTRLTSRPVVVLNSHTMTIHVAETGNSCLSLEWTPNSTRTNAKGSAKTRKQRLRRDQLCRGLPKGSIQKHTQQSRGKKSALYPRRVQSQSGRRTLEVFIPPGHTRMRFLMTARMDCSLQGHVLSRADLAVSPETDFHGTMHR